VKLIIDEILQRLAAGERVALCTIVATHGSTPQEKGAKMLVAADGRSVGTLGGGCVEAEVRKHALELMLAGASRLMEFKLDHDYGWDDGLICGGSMDVYIQSLDASHITHFEAMRDAIAAHEIVTFAFAYEQAGETRKYVEEVGPGPVLLIAGAGHVGQALAELAAKLEFRVVVIDDRDEFASEARFPRAERRIIGDIETELRRWPIDPSTFIVIVTRGHARDGRALAAVIDSPARYIGLIGSRRKIKTIFDDLSASGVGIEKLSRVHAPIGFDIGAVTVNEIAVSIAAELIAHRRAKRALDEPANPMKVDRSELRKWLSRSR
jgi:xanthine dehydrogenase accessory factor